MNAQSQKEKNGYLGLVLALAVTIGIYFLISKPRKTTIPKEEIEFSVKDTSSIQEISLIGYVQGNEVGKTKIQRELGSWKVDGKYPAQTNAVDGLVKTVFAIQMREPVHPNAKENVLKFIKNRNVHVRITQKDGLVTGYFIGPASPDSKGTYILKEGAENPYIAEIPGFEGYLSTRFVANPDVWRDFTVWNCPPEKIQKYEIFQNHKKILLVEQKNQNWFKNLQIVKDSTQIQQLKNSISKCVATGLAIRSFPNSQDSLQKINPHYVLSITAQKNYQFYLWENQYGAFFIVPVTKNSQGKVQFQSEVLLIQKLTFQNLALLNPSSN